MKERKEKSHNIYIYLGGIYTAYIYIYIYMHCGQLDLQSKDRLLAEAPQAGDAGGCFNHGVPRAKSMRTLII